MAIRFRCGVCNKLLKAPDDGSGRKGRCPHCGIMVRVPGEKIKETSQSSKNESQKEDVTARATSRKQLESKKPQPVAPQEPLPSGKPKDNDSLEEMIDFRPWLQKPGVSTAIFAFLIASIMFVIITVLIKKPPSPVPVIAQVQRVYGQATALSSLIGSKPLAPLSMNVQSNAVEIVCCKQG